MELENMLIEFRENLEKGVPKSEYRYYIDIMEHCMTHQMAQLFGESQNSIIESIHNQVNSDIAMLEKTVASASKCPLRMIIYAMEMFRSKCEEIFRGCLYFQKTVFAYDGSILFSISNFGQEGTNRIHVSPQDILSQSIVNSFMEQGWYLSCDNNSNYGITYCDENCQAILDILEIAFGTYPDDLYFTSKDGIITKISGTVRPDHLPIEKDEEEDHQDVENGIYLSEEMAEQVAAGIETWRGILGELSCFQMDIDAYVELLVSLYLIEDAVGYHQKCWNAYTEWVKLREKEVEIAFETLKKTTEYLSSGGIADVNEISRKIETMIDIPNTKVKNLVFYKDHVIFVKISHKENQNNFDIHSVYRVFPNLIRIVVDESETGCTNVSVITSFEDLAALGYEQQEKIS